LDAAKPEAHTALLEWMEKYKSYLGSPEQYNHCVQMVKDFGFEVGKPPFVTVEKAENFFRYPELDTPTVVTLGAAAFNKSQEYKGM
jgi:hypothetical protein